MEGAVNWELGVCMFSGRDEDGFPVAQFDAQGKDPRVEPIELHHTFGFASMPRDPELDNSGQPKEGKACNMWFGTEGNTMHAQLGFDPRFIATFPKLEKGGSMQYCAPGSFTVMDGDDGTVTTYVPVPNDKAHVVTVGLDGNQKPFVGIEHADGMAVTMLEHSLVIKNSDGSVYVEVNNAGVTINGNTTVNGGMTIGNPVGALPATIFPLLAAYLAKLEQDIATSMTAIGAGTAAAGATGASTFTGGASARLGLMNQAAALNTKIA